MESNDPAISVIVPAYNASKYITFCIDSILNQTFQDFELIIVDDASTDDTYDICQELYGDIDGVTLFRNSANKGQWYARNMGIIKGKGKYVYFMDNDDELLPWALETLYRKAEEEQADVVHTNLWMNVYCEERMMARNSLWKPYKCVDSEPGWLEGLSPAELVSYQCDSMPMPWLNLYRKEFLAAENIEFPPMVFGEDVIFSIEVCLKAKKYYRINDTLYLYRCYFDQKGRTVRRFPRALPYVPIMLENYNRIFGAFSEERFPFSVKCSLISGLLGSHLANSVYNIMDAGDKAGFEIIKQHLHLLYGEEAEFATYLLYMLQTSSGYHEKLEIERKEKIAKAREFFAELESGKSIFAGDFSYIYCESKLAVHIEGGDNKFYCMAYKHLAEAALELGRTREALEACDKAVLYAQSGTDEFAIVTAKGQEARRYNDAALEEYAEENKVRHRSYVLGTDEESSGEKEIAAKYQITFGAVLHYKQINDGILLLWRNVLEQVPGSVLIIKSYEFAVEAMMVEAGERFFAAGIDLKRLQCQGIGGDYLTEYHGIDICLGTYPVQEADNLLDALYMGVPTIVFCGPSEDAQLCKRVLNQVGLSEFVADSREEYVSKAVELAKNPERLEALHEKLRGRLEKAAVCENEDICKNNPLPS